jgi:hypothetical protein
MGCHMASYSGDFEVITDLSETDLIKRVADKFSKKLGCNEAGYTAVIIYTLQSRRDSEGFQTLGGEQVVMEISDSRGACRLLGYPSYADEETKWTFEPNEFAKEMDRIANLILDCTDKIVKERKEAEKQKKAAEKEAAHQATIIREKQQLEALKAKYEQQTKS